MKKISNCFIESFTYEVRHLQSSVEILIQPNVPYLSASNWLRCESFSLKSTSLPVLCCCCLAAKTSASFDEQQLV